MSDRTDPTQRTFTAGPADGTAAQDAGSMTDAAVPAPDGTYATGAELQDWAGADPDAHAVPDIMHAHPGAYYTQGPAATRETGQPYPFTGSYPVYFDAGYLAGVSVRETAGAAAVLTLRDGSDASAPALAEFALPAGGAVTEWFLPGGIKFTRGLYVHVSTGTVAGVAYTARTITL